MSFTSTGTVTAVMRTAAMHAEQWDDVGRPGRPMFAIGERRGVVRITVTQSGTGELGVAVRCAWGIMLPCRGWKRHTVSLKARCVMQHKEMRMRLAPVGESTLMGLRISGSVPRSLPLSDAQHLIRWLAGWSGWPVTCALCADRQEAVWCGWWTAHLADMPEVRRVRVQYTRANEKGVGR
jgi:hypothetical protein